MEACFEESFGTACLSGLNIVDSAVVCKALNFPGGEYIHVATYSYHIHVLHEFVTHYIVVITQIGRFYCLFFTYNSTNQLEFGSIL